MKKYPWSEHSEATVQSLEFPGTILKAQFKMLASCGALMPCCAGSCAACGKEVTDSRRLWTTWLGVELPSGNIADSNGISWNEIRFYWDNLGKSSIPDANHGAVTIFTYIETPNITQSCRSPSHVGEYSSTMVCIWGYTWWVALPLKGKNQRDRSVADKKRLKQRQNRDQNAEKKRRGWWFGCYFLLFPYYIYIYIFLQYIYKYVYIYIYIL